MMKAAVVLVLACCALHIDAASVYPTVYPFSKDANIPPELPDTKPNETKAIADSTYTVGGYVNRYTTCDPYSESRLGLDMIDAARSDPGAWRPGFYECSAQIYAYVKQGVSKVVGTPNCTANGLKPGRSLVLFSSKDSGASGMINGQKVCTKGACCKFVDGMHSSIDVFDENAEALNTIATNAACPALSASFAEPLYCTHIVMGHNCVEYFPEGKTNARIFIKPCYDVYWKWFVSCKLLSTKEIIIETLSLSNSEPKEYFDTISMAQMISLEGIYRVPDRVCHPYTYYEPAGSGSPPTSPSHARTLTCSVAMASLVVGVFC